VEEKLPNTSRSDIKSQLSKLPNYRGVIFVLLTSIASGCVSAQVIPNDINSDRDTDIKSEKINTNISIRDDFYHDLDPGEIKKDSDLDGVLDALPMLYYKNNAEIESTKPSNSPVFSIAKLIFNEINSEIDLIKKRAFILEQLKKVSKPDIESQNSIQKAYDDNWIINVQLESYWPDLKNTSLSMLRDIQTLVNLEAEAASKTGAVATVQGDIENTMKLIPLATKEDYLLNEYNDHRNIYKVEKWLQPPLYKCDDFQREGSGLILPSASNALKELILLHLEAALQRKSAYLAIQTCKKYDSSTKIDGKYSDKNLKDILSKNDEIIDGWSKLIVVEGANSTINKFVTDIEHVSKMESKMGSKIGRCDTTSPIKE